MADEGRWLNEIGSTLGALAKPSPIPDAYDCTAHGSYKSTTDDGLGLRTTCPTCEAVAQASDKAWRGAWGLYMRYTKTGVPKRHQTRTLENFRALTPTHAKVLAAVRGYIAQTGNGNVDALALLGGVGLGKTHLAVAIVNALVLEDWNCVYRSVPDLLAEIRATFNDDNNNTAEQVLAPLMRADLVVLDEVAATRGTDWEQLQLSALIDDRYRNGGSLVICSNASLAELPQWIGERAADRLSEFGMVLTLTGSSYRPHAPSDEALRAAPPAVPKPETKIRLHVTIRGVPGIRTIWREEDGRYCTHWAGAEVVP